MTTYASAPFERLKDFATINTLVYVARQIETAFLQQFANSNKSARVNKQMAAVAFQILKNMENLEYLENVDELFAQLAVEDDPTVLTRALVSIPADPVDNLHQIVTKLVLF
jgi:phage tail sheath gpL-like